MIFQIDSEDIKKQNIQLYYAILSIIDILKIGDGRSSINFPNRIVDKSNKVWRFLKLISYEEAYYFNPLMDLDIKSIKVKSNEID